MKADLLTSTYERIRMRLFTKARTMLADDEKARDVLQDAFYKLWQVRSTINQESHAVGMFVSTVRNLSIDNLRRHKAHPEESLNEALTQLPADDGDIQQQAETYARVQLLISEHLSARDQGILLHRDRDEWSFEDLAQHYNTSEANVRLIVARARKTIREIYNKR